MNFNAATKEISLLWSDILWGYNNRYLGWVDVVNFAKEQLVDEKQNELIAELSEITKSTVYKIKPLLEALSYQTAEADCSRKWLYIVLKDIFLRKNEFKDPLGEVEKIYEDFEYPDEIESFVRYMPPTDGYDAEKHLHEENITRLYYNWEKFLNDKQKKYSDVPV